MRKLILTILICLPGLLSCKKKQEKALPKEEKITESVYASGVIKSKNQYQVFSSVSGLVSELLVSTGDIIKKGAPIMRLTNVTAQLNAENSRISAEYAAEISNMEKLNDLKNSIELARIKMENDASLMKRQQNLWAQQIGARNELDQRELAYKSSAYAYETSKLKYTELEKQIRFQEKQSQKSLQISKTIANDYTLKSEMNGKIYSLLKEKGEMVSSQSPVATIGDASSFSLELQVDEYDISRIKIGQKILLNLDSYKGVVYEAVVGKINPLMNDRSKSFTIDATFVNQPSVLYPNLTCEANIVVQEKEKTLTISRDYLLDGNFVLLENNEKRKVVIGLKDYYRVEILSGLSKNETILKPTQ